MTQSFLRYNLQDGYLHHWLVAGPQLIATHELPGRTALNGPSDSGIAAPPCEQAKFTVAGPTGAMTDLTWRYARCDDDHLLDLTGDYPPRHDLRAWAYAELNTPLAQPAHLTWHTFGPAQVWLNGQPLLAQEGFSTRLPHGLTAEIDLVKGSNSLLVCLEQWVEGAVPYGLALHLGGVKHNKLKVRLPTLNPKPEAHHTIEDLALKGYIERDLYAGSEYPQLKWAGAIRSPRRLMVRVQKPAGAIVWEAQPVVETDTSLRLLEALTVKDGPYKIRLMAEFEEFIRGQRVNYDLDVNLLHSPYVDEPQGEPPDRAIELLQHAAWWTEGLFSAMALMALGLWRQVNEAEVRRAMDLALAGGEGGYKLRVGLLLLAYRYAPDAAFPQTLAERLEACLLGFDYEGQAETGPEIGGLAEDLAILRYTAEVLAGQLYPDRPFAHSGQSGQWHQARGEQGALAWLTRRARGGFAAWDSGEGFEAMLLGLIALVDHAASETLSEMAAAITDKLLFSLALNSFQGVFGSTHGATNAASITDGRMDPTAGVSRLLWGVGSWNQHTAAGLALAGSHQYQCPPLLPLIALDRPEALWSRERHVVAWHGPAGELMAGREVNKVTYKTPDYMLCSAQDYCPGEPGADEHIWQATLSPEAVVFVNHPGCLSQAQAYRPNFWRGNGRLPRVAQWRDLLIALHRLPDDDWLGYTHAHFPLAAFDEHTFKDGWAFARKGNAYLALTASGGMTLIKRGPGAYRELRATAGPTIWLCHMGRAAQDGNFAQFRKAILALPLTCDGLSVSLVSLRGEPVTFDWTGPFTVKGVQQPLRGFNHYESPHCTCEPGAADMDIKYDAWTLRLKLDTL